MVIRLLYQYNIIYILYLFIYLLFIYLFIDIHHIVYIYMIYVYIKYIYNNNIIININIYKYYIIVYICVSVMMRYFCKLWTCSSHFCASFIKRATQWLDPQFWWWRGPQLWVAYFYPMNTIVTRCLYSWFTSYSWFIYPVKNYKMYHKPTWLWINTYRYLF
jgi:hypothetical protein